MQKHREYRERRRARTRGAAHQEDVNERGTESLARRLSRWWRLRQGDGLSRNAYAAMLAGQGGVCATCRRPHADPLVVDRSRVTGEVRGLLCRRCKAALPWFRDDHALLLRAIAYLKNGGRSSISHERRHRRCDRAAERPSRARQIHQQQTTTNWR